MDEDQQTRDNLDCAVVDAITTIIVLVIGAMVWWNLIGRSL